jgi:RimJ/RimL family protein N-acetyltransferase
MIPPTLRTARLTLRPMREADYPAYRVMMMSERAKYVGGPHDETTAWLCFCHDVACWTLFGHGALMIEVTATGETVGQVGVNGGPLFPEKELGWLLYKGFEGHGYVSEAAAAMRAWAFGALGVTSLVSYIDPENTRSAAVAERLGAVYDAEATRQDGDLSDLVYRHHRPN